MHSKRTAGRKEREKGGGNERGARREKLILQSRMHARRLFFHREPRQLVNMYRIIPRVVRGLSVLRHTCDSRALLYKVSAPYAYIRSFLSPSSRPAAGGGNTLYEYRFPFHSRPSLSRYRIIDVRRPLARARIINASVIREIPRVRRM